MPPDATPGAPGAWPTPTPVDAGPVGNALVGGLAWLFTHSLQLAPLVVLLCFLVGGVCLALVWLRSAARWVWTYRQLRWAWQAWRGRSGAPAPSGGAGGHTHSAQYQAVMQSAGWRRRRAQAIRQAGRRCQECGSGGPLDVHHLSYAHLGDERPYELVAVCEGCHQRLHGRG